MPSSLSSTPPSPQDWHLDMDIIKHDKKRECRPLDLAAVYNQREMSMFMLGLSGPDVDLGQIHIAAETGDLSFLRALVEHGLDFDLRNERGLTPLHYAVTCSRVPVVRFLLAQYRHGGGLSKTCCGSRRG